MAEADDCADVCQQCHDVCLETLTGHCLEVGGRHVEKRHVILMLDCIAICQTSADFIRRASPMAAHVCRACAAVCEACAESCEHVGGMDDCASTCRRCAESCRGMAG